MAFKFKLSFLKNPYLVMVALVLGCVFGYFFKSYALNIKFFGDIFIMLLKMLIIPVIFFGIIIAIAKLGDTANAGKTIGFTSAYFVIFSGLAAIFGLILALIFKPGNIDSTINVANLLIPDNISLNNLPNHGLLDFIVSIIPQNPFLALSEGNMLQSLFISILFGLSLAAIKNQGKEKFINALEIINEAIINLLQAILYLMPFAVFSLAAYLVSSLGLELLNNIAKVIILAILGGVFWIYVLLGLVVVFVAKVSYVSFIKNIVTLQIAALTTASSVASLPITMDTSGKLGTRKSIYQIILPVGAIMHKNGAALYYTLVVAFTAQLFDIDLSFSVMVAMVVVATLASLATPGIPGFSLAVLLVMGAANVPLVAIPIIIAVDRILDMFLTVVNVVGDVVCAAVIDRIVK